VAVGSYDDAAHAEHNLIERWDGLQWTVEQSPDPGANVNVLLGVSCPAPRACTAVGLADAGGDFSYTPVALRWEGYGWTLDDTPHNTAAFEAVACDSAAACLAVGGLYENPDSSRPFAARYHQ
jgi:hypothetical protein